MSAVRPPVSCPTTAGWRLAALSSVFLLAIAGPAFATPQKSAQYYEDALKRSEKDDWTGAAVQLRNALKEDGKNLAAHLLLGKVLLRSGELKAAEAAFETALKQGVSKVEVAPVLGQTYLKLGNTRSLLETITPDGLPAPAQAEVLALRGSAYAMSGNFSAASKSFADARIADPGSALADIAEAPVLLRQGERDKARAMAQRATQSASGNPAAWFQLGSIHFALGEVQSALQAFDKSLALNGRHVDARVSRASALVVLSRKSEAAVELQVLKDGKAKEPRASFLRATLAQERGDTATARAEFVEAANLIDALSPNVRANSEPLLLAGALSHRALGNREKSRDYLETLISRNGRNEAAQMLLASTLMEGNELTRAVPIIEGLLRSNPNDAQALYMMGNVHMSRKEYAQAAEFFEKAAKIAPSGPALRDLSFSQLGAGLGEKGLANLEKAHANNPKDMRAGMELAVLYARAGDSKRAVKVAETLLAQDPGNLVTLSFLANVRGRLGDMKGFKSALDQVLAKDPKFRPAVLNMSWFDMEEGRLDQARVRLRTFLKDSPGDADVLFQLGALENQAQKWTEADAYWTQASNLPNKDARPGLALVDLYLRQGNPAKALATAKALAGRFDQMAMAHIALARAYFANAESSLSKQTLLTAATKAGTDFDLLLSIARMQLESGNTEGAIYSANKVLQARANDVGALVLLVEAAGRKGVPAEVDKALSALQAQHPRHPATLITAGHVAFSRNQLPKALGLYRQVFDKEPSTQLALNMTQAYVANREEDKALAFLTAWSQKRPSDNVALRALAEIQLLTGNAQNAKASFDALAKALPNDATILAAQAQALSKLGDTGALGAAERAFKLSPSNPAVADTYGWMLLLKGDAEGATRVLREARLREPGNSSIRWHLAAALFKGNKKSEAAEELKAALGLSPPPKQDAELDKLRAALGI